MFNNYIVSYNLTLLMKSKTVLLGE